MCSEGTPHRVGRGRCLRHGEYAAFLSDNRDRAIIINELELFSGSFSFILDHFLDHKPIDLHGVLGEAAPPSDQSRTAKNASCGDSIQSNAGRNHTHRNQFTPSSPFDGSASADRPGILDSASTAVTTPRQLGLLVAGGAIRREVLSFSQYCWHQIYAFNIATLYGFEYTIAVPSCQHYFSVLVAGVCVDLFPTNFFS